MSDHIGSVNHCSFGTADLDGLADGHGGHVFGDVSRWVGFYEKVEIAGLVVARDGSIGANDFFAFNVSGDRNMLADWKTEDRVWFREGKAVARSFG